MRRAWNIGIICVISAVTFAAAMSRLSTRWFAAVILAAALAQAAVQEVLRDRPKRLERRRRERSERGQCAECGYSLAGNVSGVRQAAPQHHG